MPLFSGVKSTRVNWPSLRRLPTERGRAGDEHSGSTPRSIVNAPREEQRNGALDGLRGLAAFSVFLSHAQGMIPTTVFLEMLRRSPARVLWDGAAAVSLFFVLSGFVLSLPFVGLATKKLDVADFLVRRVFRIYPAYLVAICLSLILRLHGTVQSTEVSEWFRHLWTIPITRSDIIGHAILIGPRFNTNAIDPVIWSMVIEMRISILMPAFILILRRTTLRADLLILAAAVLLGGTGYFGLTTCSVPFFIGGILVAKHRQSVLAFARGLGLLWKLAFLAASMTLFGIRMFGYETSTLMGYVSGAGATGLILSVLCFPTCNRIASSKVAVFLGEISYSFYLVHLPVLIFLTSWLLPATHSLLVCWTSSLCASLLLSRAMRGQLEVPLQRLGKLVWPATRAWVRSQLQPAE